MRNRPAQPPGLVAAVDRVAPFGEEDGMRHRRVVPLPREMLLLHAEGGVAAARGVVAAAAGRDRPGPAHRAVDRDRHALRRLVDGDENCRIGGRRRGDE